MLALFGRRLQSMIRLTILSILILACLLVAAGTVRGAVGLSSFVAEPGSEPGQIEVRWSTESETDVIAFQIRRSGDPVIATGRQINELPARGSAVTGWTYIHEDNDLDPGRTYYYWLYEVTTNGNIHLLRSDTMTNDFVSQVAPGAAGDVSTSTPTATPTATRTPTATAEPSPTSPPDPTQTPTSQGAVQNRSSGPTPTDIPTLTPTPSPTAAGAGTSPTQPETPSTSTPRAQPATSPSPAITLPPTAASTILSEATAPPPAPDPAQLAAAEVASQDSPQPTHSPTAQAVAQVPASSSSPGADASPARQIRPTATPRPEGASTPSNASSLLLVVGAGGLCGALVLLLAVVFILRNR